MQPLGEAALCLRAAARARFGDFADWTSPMAAGWRWEHQTTFKADKNVCPTSRSEACLTLGREQQAAGGFEVVDDFIEEAGGGGAIDEAVVVGQREGHHQADGHLVIDDDRHLPRAADEED